MSDEPSNILPQHSDSLLSSPEANPPAISPAPNPALEIITGGKTNTAKRPDGVIVDMSKIGFWKESQEVLMKLERSFGAPVIAFFLNDGFSLTPGEVPELYNHLHLLGRQERLVVMLQGHGGAPIAAYRAVKLLRRFAKRLTIVVPDEALSAMTMLSLGADEILVGPLSVFSPTDTSIANHPLAPVDGKGNPVTVEIFQLKKYLELVESERYSDVKDFRSTPHHALTEKIHPIFLGSIQRSSSLSKQLMSDILRTHLDDEGRISRIVEQLNDTYPSHAYPILADNLREMGLRVGDLTDAQNTMAIDLASLLRAFARGFVETKSDQRKIVRRAAVIESREMRSFYAIDRDERLNNNVWSATSTVNEYRRAGIVNTKRGYYEARVLSSAEFRRFLAGESIEVE